MRYVSIVGTQVMAVLNPLLALIERNEKPQAVHLLATSRSRRTAEAVQIYLLKKAIFDAVDVTITDISSTLDIDATGRPPAPKVLSDAYQETGCIFNIAGGMNFQIAACVQRINANLDRFLILYPERDVMHAIRICAGGVHTHERYRFPAPLHPIELLGLQGVRYEKSSTDVHTLFLQALKACKIEIPPNGSSIQIGTMHFDYIWNQSNSLKLLKVLQNEKATLDDVRDIIAFASTRDEFQELYHREIAVLTNIPDFAKRLRLESGDKITVLQKTKGYQGFLPSMRRFFDVVNAPSIKESPLTVKTGNISKQDTVLYTILGQDITPTMISLWSHKPKKVHLFYTPSDHQIASLKEAVLHYINLMPVAEVSFHPISIDGHDILNTPLPDSPADMEVNISPGTKGQGVFLMLHALNHGGRIFSLKSPTQTLEQIPGGERKNLRAPDPAILAQLRGYRVVGEKIGMPRRELEARKDFYEALLYFIKKNVGEKRKVVTNYLGGADFGDVSLRWENDKKSIMTYMKKQYMDTVGRGECFERLIGYVMLKAGAEDIRVRLQTSWDANTEKFLSYLHKGQKIHMTDVDVVARFQAKYYAISCKSGTNYSLPKEIRTVKAVDNLFGRNCVPLFTSLHHKGPPQLKDDVYCFGPETFTDTDAMKALLEASIKRKQKSRET